MVPETVSLYVFVFPHTIPVKKKTVYIFIQKYTNSQDLVAEL